MPCMGSQQPEGGGRDIGVGSGDLHPLSDPKVKGTGGPGGSGPRLPVMWLIRVSAETRHTAAVQSGREKCGYLWVKYARIPSASAASILANPTRSNWTTFPSSDLHQRFACPLHLPFLRQEGAGNGCLCRQPLDDTGFCCPGIRKRIPAIGERGDVPFQ